MKKILILTLLVSILASTEAFAREVSQSEAFTAVQRKFIGKDVDYFILDSSEPASKNYWYFFVDADPMKGWEHECYIVSVLKNIDASIDTLPVSMVQQKMPPNKNFLPLLVKNRYGANASLKPFVAKASQTNETNTAAQRTYAIILSGGISKESNRERYWNDCSFIYQTLVNKYSVPRENIYPIMSDGNDPAVDMFSVSTGKYQSQNLDLDGDGTNDIELAATKENIANTLKNLSNKLNQDDQLFFYVIDHGGITANKANSYICLWNGQSLYDTELADMLEPFSKKLVNVNVVLGQCYSGGFIDDLTKVGCVVSTACEATEQSYSCPDKPFDEFVYHWTCAVNEASHNGSSIVSDTDKNGMVTMEEAFAYAKLNDRAPEHPLYVSTPVSVGEDLAFNHLAPAVDLYVKDNPADTGKEPNMTTDKFWLSPSIWVRNQDDDIYEHENPYYSSDHLSSIIYVRIYNRGKMDYLADKKKYVHLYWAKASTGFQPSVWTSEETLADGEVTGGTLSPCVIKNPILAGDSLDVKITWALPVGLLGNSGDNNTEKHHFCLLAEISDSPAVPAYASNWDGNTQKSNKLAQLNISIINKEDLASGTDVYIRNTSDISQKYTLELVPRTASDEQIYSQASIEMEMSPKVYAAWGNGGFSGNSILHSPSTNSRIVQFTSKESRLESIAMAGNVFDKVCLKFNFKILSALQKKYTLDLIQRDDKGKIIGGETFIVERPSITVIGPGININSISENNVTLSMDVDDSTSVRWENAEGFTIGNGKEITVTPPTLETPYYAYTLSDNGEFSSNEITLARSSMISQLRISNEKLTIDFINSIPEGAFVQIASALTGEIEITQIVEPGEKTIGVDISQLQPGIHFVSICINGDIIENRKFVK